MSHIAIRKSMPLVAALVALCALSLGAQAGPLAAIAGSWQGDKALGTVFIRADGTGEITFEADSELRMAVKVVEKGGEYGVLQAEPNKAAFYEAFGAGPNAAKRIAKEARPMKWIFRLSADRATLSGRKETTGIKYADPGRDSVSAIDNGYVRDSAWTRLSGKVAAPTIGLPAGIYPAAQKVVLSCATPGATIRYTLDGAILAEGSGAVYSGPITVANSGVLSAVAVKDGWQISDTVKAEYTIAGSSISLKATLSDFRIELTKCYREGEDVIVELKAVNGKEITRRFLLIRNRTRFFDGEGIAYDRTEGFFAGESAGSGTAIGGDLPSDIPVKFAMKFFKIPPSIKTIKLLELEAGEDGAFSVLKFKDVPIAE